MKFVHSYSKINQSKLTIVNLSQNYLLVALALLSFAVPFALHSQDFPNQLIVGTIVNALLAGSALVLSFRNSLPIILLPSIATLLSGFVFGGFSIFLAFLVPSIWLGNAAYVYAIKSLAVVSKLNYPISVAAASVIKATIIGICTLALIYLGTVPQILLFPMTVVQFATALLGGLLAGTALHIQK